MGSRAPSPDRERDGRADDRRADPARQARRAYDSASTRTGNSRDSRHAVRDAAASARFTARRTVHGAAVGQARRGRSRAGDNRVENRSARHATRRRGRSGRSKARRTSADRWRPPAASSSSARRPTTFCARSIRRPAPNCGKRACRRRAGDADELEVGGRQYIVVAAGGHAKLGTTRGDHVIAFALPE